MGRGHERRRRARRAAVVRDLDDVGVRQAGGDDRVLALDLDVAREEERPAGEREREHERVVVRRAHWIGGLGALERGREHRDVDAVAVQGSERRVHGMRHEVAKAGEAAGTCGFGPESADPPVELPS